MSQAAAFLCPRHKQAENEIKIPLTIAMQTWDTYKQG